MSNLALTASPYNNEQESFTHNNSGGGIEEKREQRNNKTIKKRPSSLQESFSTQNPNVKSMMNEIHNQNYENNDIPVENTGGGMADFTPPHHAQSTVALKKTVNENYINNNQFLLQNNEQNPDKKTTDHPVGIEGFNNLPNTYSKDYYKQYVPYYNQMSQGTGNKDQLLEKLNYMIHLLEEQKDEKTGHIMEELILYSFLGVFMIFIVDSFARAGKYVR